MCCIYECERLLGKLEREIGAPAATPAQIAQLVENLPSDTVEAPRVLSGALWRRLTELAERHEGVVPLHTWLFAQWMHHSYPRECVFPHVSGVSGPVSADEWMPEGERHATEEEMRQAIDETAANTDSKVDGFRSCRGTWNVRGSGAHVDRAGIICCAQGILRRVRRVPSVRFASLPLPWSSPPWR